MKNSMRLFALLILFVMNFSCSSESVSKLDFEKNIANYWESWIEQGKEPSFCVVNLSEIFAFDWDSIVYSPEQNEMSFWDSGKLLDSYISLQKSGCVDFFIKNKCVFQRENAVFKLNKSKDIITLSACETEYDSLSMFVGLWRWKDDVTGDNFSLSIGERNDSLLIAVNGVFDNGAKIQGYDFDNDGTTIPHVRILKSEDKIVKGKISDVCLMFYSLPENPGYKEFVLELIDSNTLLWKFEGDRTLLPSSAVMKNENHKNAKFSAYFPDYYM